MRKLLPLFALLLMLPLCAAAQDASALDVCVLIPVAFSAAEEGGTPALYCGPTQGSYRTSEQTLDLSKPYVFFGQSDCWAMVAQGTPEDMGAIGWIESAAAALPEEPQLGFDDALSAMVEEDTFLTVTPFADAPAGLCAIARGEQVLLLAQYEGWAYVQTEIGETPVRAFLPVSAIE